MNILDEFKFDSKTFSKIRDDFIAGKFSESNNVIHGKVTPPDEKLLKDVTSFTKEEKARYRETGIKAIENGELGVVIMNGGMATRFGGVVKGIVPVFDGKSFISIKIDQVKRIADKCRTVIPIYFMNSFATVSATAEHLKNNKYFGYPEKSIKMFSQFIFKRICPDGKDYKDTADEMKNYYSPGHGDFIYAVNESKVLQSFLKAGGKYLWYSNVDNLGATIDEELLGFHIESAKEMTAEMAKKYKNDKGGAPAVVDGRLQIVEGFKFPESFNQDLIRVFNTATYIFTAEALKKNITLSWYVVRKTVEFGEIIQFERLAGDLSVFLDTNYVTVEREKRFFPIKTPEDLEKSRDALKKIFG